MRASSLTVDSGHYRLKTGLMHVPQSGLRSAWRGRWSPPETGRMGEKCSTRRRNSHCPQDHASATLVGRAWRPDVEGPAVVVLRGGDIVDISAAAPTVRDLCERTTRRNSRASAKGETIGTLAALLANTPREKRDPKKPWLIAPIDLQAIKAAGVTFATSMLERVIEEKTRGDAAAAASVRAEVGALIGDDLSRLKPGSAGGDAPEGPSHREGHVVAIPRSGHRPRRGDLHQGAGDGGRRAPRRDRRAAGLDLEQPRAGDRDGRGVFRQDRRRHARQRREPARLRGALGAASRQGQGQQRLGRARALHPPVRRRILARRRAHSPT